LGQFGFPKQLAVGLLILENALAVVMEPLMGGLSDQISAGSVSVYLSRGSAVIGIVYRYSICCHFWQTSWSSALGVSGLGGNDGVSASYLVIRRYAAPAQLPLAAGLLTLAGV